MNFVDALLQKLPGSWQLPPGTGFAFGKVPSDGDLPDCLAARAGEHRLVEGNPGQDDAEYRCAKDAADVYSWRSFGEDIGNWMRVFVTQAAVASVASNASGATYQTFLIMNKLLPVGVWDVNVMANLVFYNDTAGCGASARISSPFTSTALQLGSPTANTRFTLPLAAIGSYTSDGSTTVNITTQYRTDGFGGTTFGLAGSMIAICQRYP